MTSIQGLAIKSITRFQHRKKYEAYVDELQTVKDNLEKDNTDIEPEQYLFNIYRYQTTDEILNGEGEVTFEYKLIKDDEEGMNNKEVNYLGTQANYFTESLDLTHKIGTEKSAEDGEEIVYTVILAKCIIGNTYKNEHNTKIKHTLIGAVTYDSLNTEVDGKKVYSLYTNQKAYPEYIIEYTVKE